MMEYSSDEEATTPITVRPLISLEIKPPNQTASIKRPTSRRRKEEGLKCSRVQETLKDERIVYTNKFSSDKEFNDRQRGFHDVVSTSTKSKKLKIKIQTQKEMVDCEVGSTISLSGSNINGRRGRSALQVPVDVEEYDDDMLEAAEALLMLRNGPSMAESKRNKKCQLGFDLNKSPPPSP